MMVDVNETRNGRIMEYFRVRVEDAPVVRMVNLSNNVQFQMASDKFDKDSLSEFCLNYLEGKAKVSVHNSFIKSVFVRCYTFIFYIYYMSCILLCVAVILYNKS